MPQPQRQEQSQGQIVNPAGPTFIMVPDEAVADTDLDPSEKLMIGLILNLSRNAIGRCHGSWAYLAWRLGVKDPKTAKRTVLRINEKFAAQETDWRIGIRYRWKQANLLRVLIPQRVWISWRKPVANDGGEGAHAPPREGAHAPPYKIISKELIGEESSGVAGTLFDTRPIKFNLVRASHASGDIVKRLLDAIAQGEVLYVHVWEQWRLIERANALEGYPGVHLDLAVEGQIDVTEPMEIDALQLGAVRFGC